MARLIFVLFITLLACGTTFSYKWYGIELPDYSKGNLIGEKPKDDLPIKVCEPDDQEKGKCVVLLVDEFDRLKSDYIGLQNRLKECEEGK